jgi:ATP-dependent DNA helicase DinG
MTRDRLLKAFREDTRSVLFGTDSFWEGVDVEGESLSSVVLTRLPFRVPTEPVLVARAEAIEAGGGRAFTEYTVPLAVIKFRQGFGRLIRSRSDRGVVIVTDKRIVSRPYGRAFLESLPPAPLVVAPTREVEQHVRAFLQ